MALLLHLWVSGRQPPLDLDPDDRIMTVGEVAAYLAVAPETVRKMARRGQLPAWTVTVNWQARYDKHARSTRKEWRFSKKELDAWIRARSRSQGQGS
jgi:Helix-turn-helix domain